MGELARAAQRHDAVGQLQELAAHLVCLCLGQRGSGSGIDAASTQPAVPLLRLLGTTAKNLEEELRVLSSRGSTTRGATSVRLDAAVAPLAVAADFLSVFRAPDRHLELALTLHTNRSARRRLFSHLEEALTMVYQSESGSMVPLDAVISQCRLDAQALSDLCSSAWELHFYFAFLDMKGDKALLAVTARQLSELIGCTDIRCLARCLANTGPWVGEALRAFAGRSSLDVLASRHTAALHTWRAELSQRLAQLPEPRRRAAEAQHSQHFWETYFSNLYHISWADFAEALEEFYLLGHCPVDVLAQLRRHVDPARDHRVRKSTWQALPRAMGVAPGLESIIDFLLGEVVADVKQHIYRAELLELLTWPRPACANGERETGVLEASAPSSNTIAAPSSCSSAPVPKQLQPAPLRSRGAQDASATPNPQQHRTVAAQFDEGDTARATPLDQRQLPNQSGPRMSWDHYVSQMCAQERTWCNLPEDCSEHEPLQAAALRAVSSAVAHTQRALVLRVVSGDLARNRPLLDLGTSGAVQETPSTSSSPEEPVLPALVITANGARFSGVTRFGRGSARRALHPDMQMDEPIASRSHFNIIYEQQLDRYCLMDAGSKWGTFVKISSRIALSCGDWIRVGNAEFVIRYCGGGCSCRKMHSHYKLHSLRVQKGQQGRGMCEASFPPCKLFQSDAGERVSAAVQATEVDSSGEHEFGSSGASTYNRSPQLHDGLHRLLSGMRQGSWLGQSARLCQSGACPKAGIQKPDDVHRPRAQAGTAALGIIIPIHPLEIDFISGPRTGERLTMCERRCTMGRGEGSTIQVSDPMLANVSRSHCVFEYVGERWYVRDNGSTNGTWLRLSCVLEPSKPVPLASGMSILAGVHEFRVEDLEMARCWLPSAASAVLEEFSAREQRR